MGVMSYGNRLVGLLALIVCILTQAAWADELSLSSAQGASQGISISSGHQVLSTDLVAKTRAITLIHTAAAQTQQIVPLEVNVPLEGNCEASDGSVGFQDETRKGRFCPTEYSLEVPPDADGFLIALDKQSATDVILILSFNAPVEQAEQVFISRAEGEKIELGEFLGCVRPSCSVFQPGTWFIGLVNFSSDPQTYTIAGSITPVRLESGVSQPGTVEGVSEGFDALLGFTDYTVEVPADATALRLDLESQTGGNVDLAVRFGQPVNAAQNRLVADFLADSVEGIETVTIDSSSNPALQEGTYFMTVINREPARQNFTLKATITRQAPLPPSPLKVDAPGFHFEGFGGAKSVSFIFPLTNAGTAAVNWTATVDAPWLTLDVAMGTLDPGASVTLKLSVDVASLTAGNYEGRITFSVPGFDNLILPVTLTLKAQPTTTGELLALKFATLEFVKPGDWERVLTNGCVVYTNTSDVASTVRVTLPDGSLQEFEIPSGNDVIVCGDVVHIDTRR